MQNVKFMICLNFVIMCSALDSAQQWGVGCEFH